MDISLEQNELMDLREALEAYTRSLLGDLTHADQRGYQHMLRERLRRFEQLERKLNTAPAAAPARAVPRSTTA